LPVTNFDPWPPTDDAFGKLPEGTVESLLKPENKDKLIAILKYHVIPGKVLAAAVVKLDGQDVKTVEGSTAKVAVKDGGVTINNAKVVKTSRNVEHDRGKPPGSAVGATLKRKWRVASELCSARVSRPRRSADRRKCWQRVEPDIHGLNRCTDKCLEMSRKRGVHAARNGPSGPPTPAGGPVAQPEISTADRFGSRERVRGRTLCGTNISFYKILSHQYWTGVRFRLVKVSEVSAAINARA